MSPPDALLDALAQVVSDQRREWQRERDIMEAQSRATIAELRAEVVALTGRLEEMVRERLASLRDGKDGADGVNGTDGRDAEPLMDQQIDEAVARYLSQNPPAAGKDGAPGEPGPPGEPGQPGRDGRDASEVTDEQIAAAAARWLEANPPAPGRDGLDGKDGQDGKDGRDGQPGRDGAEGAPGKDGHNGKDGDPGREGPPGKLPVARSWEDRVYYEGEVATRDGATWQAQRDTGRAPPHEAWACIAAAGLHGLDGRSFTIRGTWDEAETYRALDVVALNGASFAARRDAPGPCPGDGWQMIAAQGKRGNPGEPGRALRGERGPAGQAVVAMDVDAEGMLTLTNGDGTTVTLDLYPLLSKIAGA